MALYYDSRTGEMERIPDAPCYVCSNDTFMSGWGRAKGLTNTVVVPCPDLETAHAVAKYAEGRGDQQRTRIVQSKPRSKRRVLYSLQPGWLDRAKEVE